MRIVQLTRDFPPAASGIGDHVARVSKEIAASGDDVVVICSSPADPSAGIDVRPVVERWDANGVAAIANAVRDAKPDAIVWHYNPFQIGRRGLALSTASRLARTLAQIAPLTVVLHEVWYPWGRNGLRGFAWAAGQRAQIRGVIAAASRIVVTTPARKAKLQKHFPSRANNVIVVAAGATIEPTGRRAERSGIPAGAFVLAHVGAIGEGRDLTPAIAALDETDAHLLLVGRTGITPPSHARVHATGPLDHDDLSAALASADAYLFAEPTGPVQRKTSLLSAFAHGLPVIAYSGPAADPQFRDGEDLLLVEPTKDAIAHAVNRLKSDAVLREKLGAAGKAMTATRYSWRAIADGIRGAAASTTKAQR